MSENLWWWLKCSKTFSLHITPFHFAYCGCVDSPSTAYHLHGLFIHTTCCQARVHFMRPSSHRPPDPCLPTSCKYPIIFGLYSLLTRFISFLFICTARFCLVSSVVTYHSAPTSINHLVRYSLSLTYKWIRLYTRFTNLGPEGKHLTLPPAGNTGSSRLHTPRPGAT